MFLCLPDPAPLAVRCLAPSIGRGPKASRNDDGLGGFSDDPDSLIRSKRHFEGSGSDCNPPYHTITEYP